MFQLLGPLEEVNRKFKKFMHKEDPTFPDWVQGMANSTKLEKMWTKINNDYGIKSSTSEPDAPDYQSKVELCRREIRNLEFLDYDTKSPLKNLDGIQLHDDTLNFEKKAWSMKKEYLQNVVSSKSFISAAKPNYDFKIFMED